jgi:hypothetical protein
MTKRTALTAAFATTLALATSPVFAQDKRDAKARESARQSEGGRKGEAEAPRKVERAQPPREQPQREQPPREQPRAEPPRSEPRRDWNTRNEVRRNDEGRRNDDGRRGPTAESRPRTDTWRNDNAIRNERRDDAIRLWKKDEAARAYNYNRGYYDRDRFARPGYRVYNGRTYYRPYVFRPHLSISFGIFAGYPVPYNYSYPYPIAVYGYRAPRGPVVVGPGSSLYGGVALEIAPYDADVFVDGNYAGKVEDFDGTYQPLTLVYGTHRIEVQAPGLAPLVFDVTVQPGQVIPYQGELRPY